MIAIELTFQPTEERLSARPAHREVLERLHGDGVLVAAGPWGDDSGALLVFRADRRAAEQIIADDPYYSTDGVAVASIREWLPIVGPG